MKKITVPADFLSSVWTLHCKAYHADVVDDDYASSSDISVDLMHAFYKRLLVDAGIEDYTFDDLNVVMHVVDEDKFTMFCLEHL